jgi:arylsulfatase A-like enzyme
MIVGFKSPHGPFTPPERLDEMFREDLARPARNASSIAPYKGKLGARAARANAATNSVPDGSVPGPKAQMIRNYFRTIAGVDENLGRLLQALDDLGLAGNTIVVYTSDNGFYLGEHGLADKRSAYDESMRIPLLVRYPKLANKAKGKVIDGLVLNIDLAPTFLDFAGLRVPKDLQGKSWRPLLEGRKAQWHRAFFYEYFFEQNFAIPTTLAVRTETAKLIQYPGHNDWTELFDLKADPYETNNLARDPVHAKLLKRMDAEFQKQAKAVDFKFPDYADKLPEDIVR